MPLASISAPRIGGFQPEGDGEVIVEGTPEVVNASPRPAARQFLDGLPDGPVAYHYPASDYQVDLFQGES